MADRPLPPGRERPVTGVAAGAVPPEAGAAVDAVEVWALPVGALAEDVLDPGELDAGEHERLRELRRAVDRVRYGAAHIALRRLLAPRLGVAPADLVFFREPCPCCDAPHGRPAVRTPSGAPHFSLSHGGDWVLIALAPLPVGVDVEPYPPAADVPGLTAVLHPQERREIAGEAYGPEAFGRIWARKEAYLKGLGTGIARPLDADYVGGTGGTPGPEGWQVTDVPVGEGHAAAVAVRTPVAGPRGVRMLPAGFVTAARTARPGAARHPSPGAGQPARPG